ncbi:MAG TPA: MGMT family protein [Chiayiivirga sp.]|nr:MGMT family protein [Chiayiivirga sp.]
MAQNPTEQRRLRILAAVRQVPEGRTAGYGQIAARAGCPRCARLVAKLLAQADEALPWHRILRSDGRIAFPAGSPEFEEQVARLRGEGVVVENGRVRRNDEAQDWLDQALWGEVLPGPRGAGRRRSVRPA